MDYTWIVLATLLLVNIVLCKKCDLKDTDCLTRWSDTIYPIVANGAENIRPSDPLHRNQIDADLPTFKYTLRNADLIGMKDCSVTRLAYYQDKYRFEYYIQCPHIIITADHEAKGDIAGFNVDIKGSLTITADNYTYQFSGDVENETGTDGKRYIQIKNYEVDAKANGHLSLDFKNDYDGSTSDFITVQKYMNDNWKDIDDLLRKPVVNSFMALYLENVNSYLKVVPFEPFVPDD